MLVLKYHDSNCKYKSILTTIDKAINSSIELCSKKKLIEDFIKEINASINVDKDWQEFIKSKKNRTCQLSSVIIVDEKLKPEETQKFINN